MSFWDALSVLRHRWTLSVPALFLAIGVAAAAFLLAPAAYQAQADVLFLPSTKSPDSDTPINPYMGLGPTLGSTADVITRVMTTPQAAKQVAEQGGTASYLVAPDLSTSAPVLVVTAKDPSAAVAALTTQIVVDQVQRTLRQQQQEAGAPPGTWVSANLLVRDEPKRLWKGQVRLGLGAFAGTALLLLAGLFAIDGRRRPRAARRRSNGDAGTLVAPQPRARPERGRADQDPVPLTVRHAKTRPLA
jgi:hypothetical protein